MSRTRIPVLLAVILAALLTLPARAAHKQTVAQLEQTLAEAYAAHRTDAEIAHQLGEVELSERLTTAALNRFAGHLPLEPRAALALQLLADESALLDPPAAEFPATEPPDPANQQQFLELARGYVVNNAARLPNFFVKRTTNRFDDTPQSTHPGDFEIRIGLHPVGTSSRTVTFRDGLEIVDTTAAQGANAQPDLGLYTRGEFGPILSRVFTDLVKGKTEFSHWEQTPAGLAAVYRFQVPKTESHYQVHFCCNVLKNYVGRQVYGTRNVARNPSEPTNPAQATDLKPFDATPGYHGTVAIDPATGAILRITLQAELKIGDPIERADIVVEYGRVTIGDHEFICPTHSLAISEQPAPIPGDGRPSGPSTLLINETTFTQYHRLGASVRILTASETPPDANPAAPSPSETSAPSEAAPTETAAATPPAQPTPAPASPAPPPQPVVPEISMAAASGVPDLPPNVGPQDSGFHLRVTSRAVDVGVIALDKKGHPVTDLKPEDFEIYDNGRKVDVRSFTTAAATAAPASPSDTAVSASPARPASDESFSNRASDTPAESTAQSIKGGTVLLLDETHIAWNDLNYARGQMLKFLAKLPANERIGLYTMSGLGFRVLVEVTTDHNTVTARLKNFLPSAQSINEAQEEERRNRQQFDVVHNVADLNSVNGNHSDVADADQPVDPELMTMGSNPSRASLIILAQVARHLASIPGHKNLVWVSSDNVFAEWQDQSAATDKGPRDNETYGRRAQEAMNEAHAAVYPFDVSQLEAGTVGADTQHATVQLDTAAAENAATAASAGGGFSSGSVSNRDTIPGRIQAQMSQDVHPIQGTVRDVASATGGRTIRRSGDLAEALAGIVEDGDSTYQLSFSPGGSADGQYHAITVKLAGSHKGVTLRYRTGYLFAKEPESLHDRFRAAVWRPTDTTEIGVKADVHPSGAGWSVRVNITAGDLALAEQGGRWMDKLDIFFIQRDDAGIHADVEGSTLGLRLKPSTYQTVLPAGIPFQRAVEMKPGMGSLRVLVVDENSGRIGTITVPTQSIPRNKDQASAATPSSNSSVP